MVNPIAVVVGFIGKFPVAGMTFYNLHYLAGLQELGYEVHYVERQNIPEECYDPTDNTTKDDPSYALEYIGEVLPRHGVTPVRYSFIDRQDHCHGSGWTGLREALDRAAFVMTLADPTWFDDLERCPLRLFVDGDPLFTQVAMLDDSDRMASVLRHYTKLFTYGVRMGRPDCTIPSAGCSWIPTRPVVATALWNVPFPRKGENVTTVMNWAAWDEVPYDGRTYGQKSREFERFIGLPQLSTNHFLLALGGPAPRDRLRKCGWQIMNPLEATGSIRAYRKFIANSLADFGIAKHAYVASRSGWFSDRSTCYLAAGKPVLHQDTGFGDWLPTGEGVFKFSCVEDVLAALKEIDANYARHSRAARDIAEEYFEAAKVIRRMLDEAGC